MVKGGGRGTEVKVALFGMDAESSDIEGGGEEAEGGREGRLGEEAEREEMREEEAEEKDVCVEGIDDVNCLRVSST